MPEEKGLRDDKNSDLRIRAEEKLRNSRDELKASHEEMQEIVHDLRVHQIELEIQNEELQRAYAELKEARDKYTSLYDFAPVGYVTIDENNTIRDANQALFHLLGANRQALIGNRLSSFIDRQSQDDFYLARKRVFETGLKQVCQISMHRFDGSPFFARLESIRSGGGQIQIALIDITSEKQSRDALTRAKDELETRVQERTAQLKTTNDELTRTLAEQKQLEKEKEHFARKLIDVQEEERAYLAGAA